MKPWQGSLLCAALALLAVTPAGAAARAPLEVQPRKLVLQIETKASHGFDLRIATEGHRRVRLTLQKGPVFVSYTARGRVSRDGIEADLGRFGRISLAFAGHREKFRSFGALRDASKGLPLPLPEISRDCRGRDPVREVGRFEGEFEFEGERGFSSLRSGSLKGEVHRFYHRVCDPRGVRFHHPRRPPALSTEKLRLGLVYLGAVSRTPQRTLRLAALRIDFLGRRPEALIGPLISATASERVDGVRIFRLVNSFGGPGSLILSPPGAKPLTATVAPEPPLEGTAKLIKSPGAPGLWSGSLLARLPGLGPIPLTGPDFEVSVCRPVISKQLKKNGCLRRAGLVIPDDEDTEPRGPRLLAQRLAQE